MVQLRGGGVDIITHASRKQGREEGSECAKLQLVAPMTHAGRGYDGIKSKRREGRVEMKSAGKSVAGKGNM